MLIWLVPLSGCVSPPAPSPDLHSTGPRLTFTLAEVARCEPLGIVSSDPGPDGGGPHRLTEGDAQSRIMAGAMRMGGDVVLLSYSIVDWEGASMAGTACRCTAEKDVAETAVQTVQS